MTWIKLDDDCHWHPKVAGLSDRAFRCWVEAMCYAHHFLTDGLIPRAFLKLVEADAHNELTTAGLWVVDGEQTHIHSYLKHQTSRAHIEQERERNRKRRTGGTTGGTTGGVPPENRDQSTDHRVQRSERTRTARARESAPSARFQSSAPTAQERADYKLVAMSLGSAGFNETLTEWVRRRRGGN